MSKRAIVIAALAIVATGCGQAAPDRSPLPATPDELSFPDATTPVTAATSPGAPTTTAVPGECRVNTASGATVLSLDSGFDAADVLMVGDQITTIDDVTVGTAAGLVAALADRRPGDTVSVGFRRADAAQAVGVTVGAAQDDPAQARLGVEVETTFTEYEVTELPDLPAGPNPLLAELGDSIYFLDPTLPAWRRSPAPALGSTIVLLEGEAFARRFGTTELISLRTAQPLLLPIGERELIQILGVAAGALIVATGAVSDSDVSNPEIVSIDIDTMELLWTTTLPEFQGNPVTTRSGWVSPDGALLAVTSRSGDARLHTLLNSSGEILAGWGADTQFVRSDAAIGGWLDGTRIGYVYRDDSTIFLGVSDMAAPTADTVIALPGIAAVNQLSVVPTTDTAILASPTGSTLIDVNTGSAIHQISSGCAPVVVLATGR